jgi:hypothetical protein
MAQESSAAEKGCWSEGDSMSTTAYDTGPPSCRATPLPTRGAGIGARPSTRCIRGESNSLPRAAQRCRVILYRAGNVAFAGRLNLEDDEACRVRVVWSNQQLTFHLCSLAHLSWASTVLRPVADPDFLGQLSWENRRYLVDVHVLHNPYLYLQAFLRPLNLYHVTNQQSQLGVVK